MLVWCITIHSSGIYTSGCCRFPAEQNKLGEGFRFMDTGNVFMPSTVSVSVMCSHAYGCFHAFWHYMVCVYVVHVCVRACMYIQWLYVEWCCLVLFFSTSSVYSRCFFTSYQSPVICLRHSHLLHHLATLAHHRFHHLVPMTLPLMALKKWPAHNPKVSCWFYLL